MNQLRLKSSFIYLANAVNDLRGNWTALAVVLAPLTFAAALCLLPDALNLQSRLANTFAPGTQNISYHSHTISYSQIAATPEPTPPSEKPSKPPAPPLREPQPFSPWFTTTLHIIFGLLTLIATLLTLCTLYRVQSGMRAPGVLAEALEIYKRAIRLAPGFIWVTFLQLLAPVAAILLFQAAAGYVADSMNVALYIILFAMMIVGGLVYVWLYFAQYALIFDDKHSFHALLYSRDLMRKRFFKAAIRIAVFLAVWSGYNSWAAGAFVIVSLLFGPVGVVTGSIGTTIFVVDLAAIGVSFATAAFFVAAGLRLYQDLAGFQATERLDAAAQAGLQPTAPLTNMSA
ncbi:MAG: hypothetical protein Q7S58_09685 [Candidatus Binatus sp.]|uniref:hypothetical protein n=1 Tax=Candidatus Binatus sp. TaxID=2811406 RepID=UPI00271FB457|nr:hypothetical protein [Candidatus Binatus sp.]MDO8432666.1 hypothetical protein [Candidatus Binatus sp.]